jgi:O-antigen/teichoic acid export membrane protein
MSALLVPVGLFLVLFAHEALLAWTRNALVAERGAPLLSLLAAGTMLNGLMNVPYALQLARGNTRIGIGINVALCLLLVPAMLALTARYGVAGGAAVAPILNGLYLLVGLPLTCRLCPGMGAGSFYASLLRHQGAAVALLLAARWLYPRLDSPLLEAAGLALVLLAALALSVAATPQAREAARSLRAVRPLAR